MKQELISAIRKLAHDNAFDTEEYEALIEKAFPMSEDEKFDALLDELQEWSGLDKGDFMENLPVGLYKDHFEDTTKWEEVDSGLNVDKHRWYELSTTVYKIYGRYLGVRHVGDVFSEQMSYSDVGHNYSFNEMKPVSTITYE